MKVKRLCAYLIDLVIISIITSLIMSIPIFSKDYEIYQETSVNYMETILTSGSKEFTNEELIEMQYNIAKSSQTVNIITIGLLILYFGVFGYLCNGQTLGKKILKLKIESANDKPLNPSLFMLRSIIITNVIPRIALIITTIYFTSTKWSNITTFISNFEYIIMILIVGFMIFRDDERGLHDIICNTKVISYKNKE